MPVEDVSQRDEVTRVFANPEGTWTARTASAPERVQDATGVWHDIDTTLVETDSGLEPLHAATDVVLSAGGDKTFAAVTEHGRDLAWRWPNVLPAPMVEGNTATYEGVVAGGDLVVSASTTGFSYSIVLHRAPEGPADFTILVLTDGAQLSETQQGGLTVETPEGRKVVDAPRPLMWDSSTDGQSQSENVAAVDTVVGKNAAGTATVTLSPDDGFLSDPSTVYPVTVDPSFNTYATGDAWVQNADYTSGQTASKELRAGTYDGGGHKARSFLHFDTADAKWDGKKIESAKLVMRNFYSGSCGNNAIRASRIAESWSGSNLTWGNQPAVGAEKYDDYSVAKGYNSTCAAGDATWVITDMVQDWATGWPNNGIRLKAVDETSNNTWRKYRSTNYNDYPATEPHIDVTYNSYPNTAGQPSVTPSAAGYTTDRTPTFKATVSDPDGGRVSALFQVLNPADAVVWSKTSTDVSNNGTATVTMPSTTPLNDDTTYRVKVMGDDGPLLSKSWSKTTSFTVDATKPSMTLTASAFTQGQWTDQVPGSNTFTLDGASDTKSISYTVDGVPAGPVTNLVNGDHTFPLVPGDGWHVLTATATDKAGNTGQGTLEFGVGPASFTQPVSAARTIAQVPVEATSRPNATGVVLDWRYAGDTATPWTPLSGVTRADGTAWSGAPVTVAGKSTTERLVWDATAQEDPTSLATPKTKIQAPAFLELRACFSYATAPTQMCTKSREVELTSAFGGNSPIAQAGPATIALATGEMALSETDVVDTLAGVGRTFSSFDAATTNPGPFGMGWSTGLLAPGEAGAELVDHRDQDRTLVLVTAGGGSQVFIPIDPTADVTEPAGPVEFRPAGADDGSRMTLTAVTNPTARVTLTRPLGAVTIWEDAGDGWQLAGAAGLQANIGDTETSFEQNQSGYPTWIAQTEPGTSPTCTEQTQEAGCRGLRISYTGTGESQRVSTVELVTHAAAPQTLATYGYSGGLLTQVCGPDPDADPTNTMGPLCAGYDYTTVGTRTLLVEVTPPGQTPWKFGYDTSGRLATVTRAEDNTVGGTGTATWTIAYDLPVTSPDLPDLSPPAAAQWGQTQLPTMAAAVFTPDRPVALDTDGAAAPTAADYPYASVWYFDAAGTTTNTAVYGAGKWLVDTSWYDTHGNVVRSLDGAGRARALAEPVAEDRPAVAEAASAFTVFNDYTDSDSPVEGSRVEDEYGPVHQVTLQNGTTGPFRPHTAYTYDDEPEGAGLGGPKPTNGQGETYNLVVETRHSASAPDRTGEDDVTVVRNEYAPIVSGDGNGWELGTPTKVKTQLADGSWSTQVTRHDTQGRQAETRQPGGATAADGSGADAHAVFTSYYTKNDATSQAACKVDDTPARAAWVGLVCKTGPAGQPAGQSMPVTHYADYDSELRPTRVVESSGTDAEARITTTTYDNLGRHLTTTVQAAGDTRNTTLTYHPDNGAPIGVTGTGAGVSTDYDQWGRVKSYTDGSGMTSTTGYTPDGQVASFHDGEGTYTYTYGDPTTGEYRQLPTSVDVGLPAGTPDTFTMAYNAAGAQTKVTYPNGMIADYGYTEAGVPTSLAYTDANGTGLLGFNATVDVDGRVHGYTSDASRQDYTYDHLGRLTKTQDHRTNPDTDTEECDTRTYGFSAASERTSFTAYGPAVDGTCQTTTPAVARTSTYDSANRITNAGYNYDNLGRTITTPTADTTPDATSPLTATYHANDMIKTLTQTVADATGGTLNKRVDYELDVTGRINTIANQTNGNETSRLRYRFSGPADFPSSVETSTNAGASWNTTRYITLPGLGMTASTTGGTATYQIANLHGDIVTTAMSGGALGPYAETDEYGNLLTSGGSSRYQWLGGYQRSTDALGGIVLMGARLYNSQSGQFTSLDKVNGGNATRYTYPQDPINSLDITGLWEWRWWKYGAVMTREEAWALVWRLQDGRSYGAMVEATSQWVPVGGTIVSLAFSWADGMIDSLVSEIKHAVAQRRHIRLYVGLQRSTRSFLGVHAYRYKLGAVPWGNR